jgi:hypothetical protein
MITLHVGPMSGEFTLTLRQTANKCSSVFRRLAVVSAQNERRGSRKRQGVSIRHWQSPMHDQPIA